ncbi:MAG TPA: redoxin domain-containing protein [Candidatus Limnocylindria bacterium]|nr:redoxin domain-containing protein [Candidatus Limnocylindria bacterium]
MRRASAWSVSALLLCVAAASALAGELGDKAPELDVTGWAQGAPVTIAEGAGKTVYVVAFVATFKTDCGPSLEAVAKLHERFGAKGLAVVVVSAEPVDDVKKYLETHKTSFRFALDSDKNTLAAWGITDDDLPIAFVVDKAGAIAFQGDPTRGLDRRVEEVLAGKFDLKKATQIAGLEKELRDAVAKREVDNYAAVADKILAIDPTNAIAFRRRCEAFARKEDLAGYRKFIKELSDKVKDDARALSAIAWRLITDGRLDWRDPETAAATAKRSVDLGKSGDADALDTYAAVLGELGLFEPAIDAMKKAIALEAGDESYKRRLTFLEACLAAKKSTGAPPALPPSQPPKKK